MPTGDDDEELQAGGSSVGLIDALDASRAPVPPDVLAAWEEEGAVERLRNRFVTGARGGAVAFTCVCGRGLHCRPTACERARQQS